jgi:hypothetical protein
MPFSLNFVFLGWVGLAQPLFCNFTFKTLKKYTERHSMKNKFDTVCHETKMFDFLQHGVRSINAQHLFSVVGYEALHKTEHTWCIYLKEPQ